MGRFGFVNLIQLIVFFLLSKFLAVEVLGELSFFLAVSFILANLISFGLPVSIVYFYKESEDVKLMNELVVSHSLYIFCFFVLISVLSAFFGKYFVFWVVLLSFSQYLFLMLSSYLQAIQNFKVLNYFSIINVLSLSFLLFSILVISDKALLKHLLCGYAFSYILPVFIYIAAWGRKNYFFGKIPVKFNVKYLRIYKYGSWVYLNNMVSFANHRVDIILINLVLGYHAGGLYSFSVQVVERLAIFSQAVLTVVFPRMCKETDKMELYKLAFKFALLIQLILFPVVLLVYLYIGDLLVFVFNNKYDNSIIYIKVLLIGVAIGSSSRFFFSALAAAGYVRFNALIGLQTLLVNIALSSALVFYFGAEGVAYATVASYLISLLLVLRVWFLENKRLTL